MVVGSPEWDAMNQRRWELIQKKNRVGLSEVEMAEFTGLQEASRAAIETAFPKPARPELDALIARLEGIR